MLPVKTARRSLRVGGLVERISLCDLCDLLFENPPRRASVKALRERVPTEAIPWKLRPK